jgi:hypothetical protein
MKFYILFLCAGSVVFLYLGDLFNAVVFALGAMVLQGDDIRLDKK